MTLQHSPMDVVYHIEHSDVQMKIRPFKSTLSSFFTTLIVAISGSEGGREY